MYSVPWAKTNLFSLKLPFSSGYFITETKMESGQALNIHHWDAVIGCCWLTTAMSLTGPQSLQASLVETTILPPDLATELADLLASFCAQFAFRSCLQLTSWEHSLRKLLHRVLRFYFQEDQLKCGCLKGSTNLHILHIHLGYGCQEL